MASGVGGRKELRPLLIPGHLVAVAHPDLGLARHAGEQEFVVEHLAGRAAIFTGRRPGHLAAEMSCLTISQ